MPICHFYLNLANFLGHFSAHETAYNSREFYTFFQGYCGLHFCIHALGFKTGQNNINFLSLEFKIKKQTLLAQIKSKQ